MSVQQIVPGLHQLSLGIVNIFLLEDDAGLVLIDTGSPGSEGKILAAVRELGRGPEDVSQILVTHLHADHTGSLAALKQATGALAAMHPADADLVRRGISGRGFNPAPGFIPWLVTTPFMRTISTSVSAAEVEQEIHDGEMLPIAGGLQVVHVPGHSAGQVAFFWAQHGGILFVADAASNVLNRLGYSIVYEDVELGRRSLRMVAALEFKIALFGHGRAIINGASSQFRKKWGGDR